MREQTESQIQSAFFEWLSLHEKKYPELSLCYAIPNGAHKSIASRMKFKREGLKAGVPDVHLPLTSVEWPTRPRPRSFFAGLWIEFKSDKGRVSDTQKEWIEKLTNEGHRVEVCRDWTQAANIVIDYLQLPIEKLSESPSINGKRTSTR
jgi:hypothetical protein